MYISIGYIIIKCFYNSSTRWSTSRYSLAGCDVGASIRFHRQKAYPKCSTKSINVATMHRLPKMNMQWEMKRKKIQAVGCILFRKWGYVNSMPLDVRCAFPGCVVKSIHSIPIACFPNCKSWFLLFFCCLEGEQWEWLLSTRWWIQYCSTICKI